MKSDFLASVHNDYLSFIKLATDAEIGAFIRAQICNSLNEKMPELTGMAKALFETHNKPKYDINRIYGRYTEEYKSWRIAVFIRDSFTCQCCEKPRGKLNAHHIMRFRDNINLRTDIDNGVTLCEKCHKELHKREGR